MKGPKKRKILLSLHTRIPSVFSTNLHGSCTGRKPTPCRGVVGLLGVVRRTKRCWLPDWGCRVFRFWIGIRRRGKAFEHFCRQRGMSFISFPINRHICKHAPPPNEAGNLLQITSFHIKIFGTKSSWMFRMRKGRILKKRMSFINAKLKFFLFLHGIA